MNHFGDFFPSLQSSFQNEIFGQVIQVLITVSPVILALILFMIFWPIWMNYVRSSFFFSLKYAFLEIKLPKETLKSPLAMEVFLNAIHNTADGSKFSQYWKGEIRPFYSLEIISVEGQVKFIICTEDRRKGGVISPLYSQFPGIEIHEIEDYTKGIHFDPKETKIWAGEFKFTKEDPYPIKTYVDYGLDKDPKEEFKVDPMVPMIEFLGSVKANSQIWIQILVRAHKDDQRKPGHLFKKTDLWQDGAKELVNKIMLRDPKTKVAGIKDETTGFTKLPSISEGEKKIVEAIERAVSKPAFDVGIRAIYIAKREIFDTPFGIGGIIGSFKQFGSENLNGFKPNGNKWHNKFSGNPWEDYKDMRRNRESRLALLAYKYRSYFYPPFESKPLVLNTEELATIYHFPGQVAGTPTLSRIPSKKAQAPANLPI